MFEDEAGKMNRSLIDCGGGLLVVSQFTLYADCRRGRRPSFTGAARPETAVPLYERFLAGAARAGVHTEHGEFGADMLVSLENDGPVTILLDTGRSHARQAGKKRIGRNRNMYTREYKNTGDQISLLGLGCMRLPKGGGQRKDRPRKGAGDRGLRLRPRCELL